MAPNQEDGPPEPQSQLQPQSQPGDKTLHVWSKPIEDGSATVNGAANPNSRPTITEAMGMIKKDDFLTVANSPCARQGFITGIASGAGLGGLKFVVQGNATKAANWAVGFFVLGSMASYEYCQYLRRVERRMMKRQIEVVSENRREQAQKLMEARKEHQRLEAERKAAARPWYKLW
ncbi:hypothetical protein B0J13DRAFT_604186 [Dactylonectria estremocensis]|uniref:Cytochrome c oxidase assembly protein COX20, mitochondrial n=1 Tax=Dactylonectria estremocensis TaxID=1079267 RepID=A0A9P9F5G7_9HYPO|nr:hypothetical protein B0J13DRAFT_604186 [Dactylonectria estremocensis]